MASLWLAVQIDPLGGCMVWFLFGKQFKLTWSQPTHELYGNEVLLLVFCHGMMCSDGFVLLM